MQRPTVLSNIEDMRVKSKSQYGHGLWTPSTKYSL